ncbi:MAG: SGNH/GDSL hydrolase family protein [Bacteroidales bacterium]|nr:SGNH/GDSL hydrolase family protein [Bacteroidales bacterium]
MSNFKVTIFGCSVAVRIRPSEKHPNNKNYGSVLEDLLFNEISKKNILVQNFGFSRATITEIYEKLENYTATFPDFFVLNIGVPDASTREIPYWFAQILNKRTDSLIKTVFSFIHSKIIKKSNSFFVKLRGKRTWLKFRKFSNYYDEILKTLVKDTNAKIITMSINQADNRIEKIIPGSSKNYIKYNNEIKKLSEKYGVIHLNLDDLVSENHYPDGIHFNQEGHKIVAKRLFEIIKNEIE